ncbi:hypothetical protein B6D52_02465 [Candidatus Parcubacteria bacterium 4484_255]|nr:MAG: hypothetical protein B6D52_02465 [Candidatus Parcubacteria bacterium 4484_255]
MFLLIREKRKRSIFNRKKAKRNFCPLKKKNWKKKSPLLSKRTNPVRTRHYLSKKRQPSRKIRSTKKSRKDSEFFKKIGWKPSPSEARARQYLLKKQKS